MSLPRPMWLDSGTLPSGVDGLKKGKHACAHTAKLESGWIFLPTPTWTSACLLDMISGLVRLGSLCK